MTHKQHGTHYENGRHMAVVTSRLLIKVKSGMTLVSYFGNVTFSLFTLAIAWLEKYTPRRSKTIQTN